MAIPFPCPCGRALIADDAHQGQEVRCPACGRALIVPAQGNATPPPASLAPSAPQAGAGDTRPCPHCRAAVPAWETACLSCGAFVEGSGRASALRICPRCGAQILAGAASCPSCRAALGVGPARPGLPWEHRGTLGLWPAAFRTVKLILLEPRTAFRSMTPEDRLGNPLTFYLLLFLGPNVLFWAAAGGLLLAFWATLSAALAKAVPNLPVGQVTTGILAAIYLGGFVVFPLFNLAALFLCSGVFHLGLKLAGGARRPFATTFAAVAYSYTATNLVQLGLCCITLIPYLGHCISLVLILWSLCWIVMALTYAHQTDTWRVLVAVLGPVFAACGLCLGLALLHGVFQGLAASRAGM